MELINHVGESVETIPQADGSISIIFSAQDEPNLYQEWVLSSDEALVLGRRLAELSGDLAGRRGTNHEWRGGNVVTSRAHPTNQGYVINTWI